MKRKREEAEMDIVWQTPANPPERRDYIFRNGKRHVKPYYFEFISHVKKRWAGKTIVDLFAEEFKGRPFDYYKMAGRKRPLEVMDPMILMFFFVSLISTMDGSAGGDLVGAVKSGRIQVDGQIVSVSYIVQPSQKISHFLHRHEPPVLTWDVSILQKESDVLTVCKPASVPVHPCGQYRKNTVVGILQAEYGLFPLFPVHRLDRLVSGLLILARTAAKADIFRQQIEAGKVHKQYIAKVIGVFPEAEQVVNVNVNYNAREGRSSVEEGDSFGGTELKGKVACTKFTRISTDGTHSIVVCEPITGRTHQIRVHLQYTGHPIANDVLYLSETVADRSTEGTTADRAAANSEHSPTSGFSCNADGDEYEENSCDSFSIDPMCTNCPNLAPKGYGGYEEGLWLHCVKYSGPGWVYECPYPGWASVS